MQNEDRVAILVGAFEGENCHDGDLPSSIANFIRYCSWSRTL